MSIYAMQTWNAIGSGRIKKRCSVCGRVFYMYTKEHVYRAAGAEQCSYTCFRAEQKKSPAVNRQKRRGIYGRLPTREECEAIIQEDTQIMETLTGYPRQRCMCRRRNWIRKLKEIENYQSENEISGHE